MQNLPRLLGKGYIQVYTGTGKGKTTAAFGLALRATGWGLRTYIGQFMKGQDTGELQAIKMVCSSFITVDQYGGEAFIRLRKPLPPDSRYFEGENPNVEYQ